MFQPLYRAQYSALPISLSRPRSTALAQVPLHSLFPYPHSKDPLHGLSSFLDGDNRTDLGQFSHPKALAKGESQLMNDFTFFFA